MKGVRLGKDCRVLVFLLVEAAALGVHGRRDGGRNKTTFDDKIWDQGECTCKGAGCDAGQSCCGHFMMKNRVWKRFSVWGIIGVENNSYMGCLAADGRGSRPFRQHFEVRSDPIAFRNI